jgi:hypothetical protein
VPSGARLESHQMLIQSSEDDFQSICRIEARVELRSLRVEAAEQSVSIGLYSCIVGGERHCGHVYSGQRASEGLYIQATSHCRTVVNSIHFTLNS